MDEAEEWFGWFADVLTSSGVQFVGEDDRCNHRRVWTEDEDVLLTILVAEHGEDKWSLVAHAFPGRTPDSVRNRFARLHGTLVAKGSEDPPPRIGRPRVSTLWTKEEEIRLQYAVSTPCIDSFLELCKTKGFQSVRNKRMRLIYVHVLPQDDHWHYLVQNTRHMRHG